MSFLVYATLCQLARLNKTPWLYEAEIADLLTCLRSLRGES